VPAKVPSNNSYRPSLPSDKRYIQGVSDTIRATDMLEVIEFKRLNDSLKLLGIDQDPYALVSLDNLASDAVGRLCREVFEKIQDRAQDVDVQNAVKSLWDYLTDEDALEPSELAFVFGGPNPRRAEEAIQLYKSGMVKKILFSGKHASYMKVDGLSEAELYRDMAIAAGVSESDIMLETAARNTPENAAFSVKLMKELSYRPASVIAITLPYHMLRSYFTLKAVTDWQPTILRKVAPSAKFTRDNYYMDPNGWSYIFNEYIKLYGARLMRHF
jgi:hypothetical protein